MGNCRLPFGAVAWLRESLPPLCSSNCRLFKALLMARPGAHQVSIHFARVFRSKSLDLLLEVTPKAQKQGLSLTLAREGGRALPGLYLQALQSIAFRAGPNVMPRSSDMAGRWMNMASKRKKMGKESLEEPFSCLMRHAQSAGGVRLGRHGRLWRHHRDESHRRGEDPHAAARGAEERRQSLHRHLLFFSNNNLLITSYYKRYTYSIILYSAT